MIQIEKTEVYGWEAAVRGMRNPLNSWNKSDSVFIQGSAEIGGNDLSLMKRLAAAGPVHGKYLRMITVTADVTAPLYWWKEYDTYKVGTVANSCSTMHKIHAREFTAEDFSHEHLEPMCESQLMAAVHTLNICRRKFLETGDKLWRWQMIQLLPSSYNQRHTVQLNYAVLKAIIHDRRNHKLDEWHDFCAWAKSLPYSELIAETEEAR